MTGGHAQAAPFAALAAGLAELDGRRLRRARRVLDGPQGARIRVDGRAFVAFCSNDYLGLAADPALIAAARAGAARYGVGAGASHLLVGHGSTHHELEGGLAAFVGLPRALLFSTGYQANIGVITALVGRGDAVFADRLNHASLNDAAVLARAQFRRYPHRDLAVLERMLRSTRARRRLIATDAVFSMDGDVAPVPELIEIAERHDAWLLLDDAHGFGVLGTGGRGVLSHFNAQSERIIYMATLGKAAGVFGAFVAGAPELVDWLVQRARSYVYTTATPPLLAAALSCSLALIERDEWRRARLRSHIATLRERLALRTWQRVDSVTAIQPVLIGGNAQALAAAAALEQAGLLVPAIRPPTVPQGTARLRISLSAAHSEEDVARLVDALQGAEDKAHGVADAR